MRISSVLFASAIAFTTYSLHASTADAPPGWTVLGEAPQLYEAGEASSPSGHGVELRRKETSHPYGNAMLVKEFPAAQYAGKNIRVDFKARADGAEPRQHGIAVHSGAGTQMTMLRGERTNGWEQGGILVSLPRDVKELRAGVWLKGPGTVTLDEIDIVVIGDAPKGHQGLMFRNEPRQPDRNEDARTN